jgi:predicted amino acid dehydrogenase
MATDKLNERINLAFISNPRDLKELKTLMMLNYLTAVPDFIDCKKIKITCGDTAYNSRLIVIGSTVEDLYQGLSGRNGMGSEDRKITLEKLQKGKEQVKAAVKYAVQDLKADVICFGAATKRLLKKSVLLELSRGSNTIFTLGDNYTTAVSIAQIKNAALENNIDLNDPDTTFAIVGAYGLIGKMVSAHFSNYRCRILLVGRDSMKLDSLLKDLNPCSRYRVFNSCDEINEKVDLLFTSTNAPGSVISNELIEKWGDKIVALDVAEPPNISEDVCNNSAGRLIRYDAGIVFNDTLEFENGNQMGLREKTLFACYSEGLIASVMTNTRNFPFDRFSLMETDSSYFDRLNDAAELCGFSTNLLQSFGRSYYKKC